MSYIDLYLLPVPTANVDTTYKEQASAYEEVIREYGAVDYREFKVNGSAEGSADLIKLIPVKPEEQLTVAIAEFDSKEHRDQVMASVMADPRIKAMENAQTANMDEMHYGGFEQFIGED